MRQVSILLSARLSVVADLANHVLRDPVGSSEDIAELVLPQNRVIGPRRRLARYPPAEGALPLGGEIPVELVNTLTRDGCAFHLIPF